MKRILILSIVMLITLSAFGQGREAMRERIKAQKVAFITERLDLSPTEAQQFWPIYNEFEEKVNTMRRDDLREVRQKMKSGDLTTDEAQDLLDQFMVVEENIHQAKKQLVKDLGNAIPPQKIIALKTAEESFNRRLMEIIKEHRNNSQKRNNKN